MKNKRQSGFVLPMAILIVVVLIVAGGVGYYFYKISVDETANWKTYTNTKHGYQLKVPNDFYNRAKPSSWIGESDNDSIDFSRGRQWYVVIQFLPNAPFYNPPLGTELIGWLKQNKVLFDDYQALDKPNFEIKGIPAVKMYSSGRPQAFNADIIYFIKDNKLFQIQALADTDDENGVDVENVKEICSQILSTFKFIEKQE